MILRHNLRLATAVKASSPRLSLQTRALSRWHLPAQQLRTVCPRTARSPIVRSTQLAFARHESTQRAEGEAPKPPNLRRPGEENPRDVPAPTPDGRGEVPAYELTFTCKPCKTRSAHRVSKHGYHHGTVLITCPNCKNRHIISDHLKVFNDESKSFEQILEEKAELLKTGVLDPEGDFEMWDDGTQTARQKSVDGAGDAARQSASPKL